MRSALVFLWMILPLLFGLFHHGPGQDYLVRDDAARVLARARASLDRGDPYGASRLLTEALSILPVERVEERRRVRLALDRARMKASQLPDAREDLENLVAELQEDPGADPALLDDARASLATSQFYMTWLMRLEGVPREAWEPEIEAARQTYRHLAEKRRAEGRPADERGFREDLEAAIRLERLDPGELLGLPLPDE